MFLEFYFKWKVTQKVRKRKKLENATKEMSWNMNVRLPGFVQIKYINNFDDTMTIHLMLPFRSVFSLIQ